MKTYYHATSMTNLASIEDKGLLCKGIEHLVYLCEKPSDCLKFVILHGLQDILVCKVRLNEKKCH